MNHRQRIEAQRMNLHGANMLKAALSVVHIDRPGKSNKMQVNLINLDLEFFELINNHLKASIKIGVL